MARIFQSRSYTERETETSPPSNGEAAADEEDEGDDGDLHVSKDDDEQRIVEKRRDNSHQQHFPIMAILAAAVRKSLACSVETGDDLCSPDIGWPTDVQHVSHVTFDRFQGFLGLPLQFEPDVPRRVPSSSVSVFGVSAKCMQCSLDQRGNSVPTILLSMQRRLYSLGGLLEEGIFRINADNGQEEHVRDLLNKGIIPESADSHCLAGLIKTWFRELPAGVLDSISPERLIHCNTKEHYFQLMRSLPTTEAALLDWAINLMTDVAIHENHNKMNAHNIAMVFAPNMTQMADPLTALIHAVQVMNFLKTLIIKTQQEREESAADAMEFSSCSASPYEERGPTSSKSTGHTDEGLHEKTTDPSTSGGTFLDDISLSSHRRFPNDTEDFPQSLQTKSEADEEQHTTSEGSPTGEIGSRTSNSGCNGGYSAGEYEGFLDMLNLKKGVRRLCQHKVLQLNKQAKKSGGLATLNSSGRGGEAWA